MDLGENKVAIVTGSSSGIGKGIAEGLALAGTLVVVTSRSLATAEQVAQELTSRGGRAIALQFLLEDADSGERLVRGTLDRCGRLDILVNNAISHRTLPGGPVQALSYEQLVAGITANLTNVLHLTALAYPHLRATNGTVLNIGSSVVNRHMQGILLYAVVKSGLTQLTRALAAEWACDGIRVNQINPGVVRTNAAKDIGIPEEYVPTLMHHYRQFHPLGRIGEVVDVAALAACILSPAAEWMTGSVIDIDGGYSVQGTTSSP